MNSVWPRLYLLLAAPVLLLLAIIFPLGEPPDEPTQLTRAASLLHGEIVGRRQLIPHPSDSIPIAMAGLDINLGFLAPLNLLPPEHVSPTKTITRAELEAARTRPWAPGPTFAEASNTASYPPWFYIPAALGLGTARLAGAAPMSAVLAGRLSGAIICLGLGWLALRLAHRNQALLLFTLLLPMTLHLQSSINQDGPMIATAALAAALLTRPGQRSRTLGLFALAALCAAKPPYLPLAILAALPLDGRRWTWRSHALPMALIVAAGFAWAAIAALYATVPFWRPPYHPGPLWPGDPATTFRATDPAAQLQTLLAHPAHILALPLTTLQQTGDLLLDTAIGRFGPLDFSLPNRLINLWYAALAGVLAMPLAGLLRRGPPPRWTALIALAAAITAVYLVFLIQYFAWSNVGNPTIDGVTGRYVLPILALLAAALPAPPPRAAPILAAPTLLAAAITAIALPVLVMLRFYVH